MKQLLHNPMAVLAAYYFVAASISGMPAPDQSSGKGYRWLYTSLHLFAANFGTISSQWKNGGNPFGPVISADSQSLKKSASKYSV